jgi:hypothetical protein
LVEGALVCGKGGIHFCEPKCRPRISRVPANAQHWMAVSDEELNDFPTVRADGPLLISAHGRGVGHTEYPQAVFANDGVVSVPTPCCLDWFVVNVRGSTPTKLNLRMGTVI